MKSRPRSLRGKGWQRAAQIIFSDFRWGAWIQAGMADDLQKAFGKLWPSIDAFRFDEGKLIVMAEHPAVRWEMRLRKREILEPLKAYGIADIQIRGNHS